MAQNSGLLLEMTPEERIAALARIAMPDKSHLKRWLGATGKTWLTFNALDLVDALRWPDGVDLLMQIIACYRDHRAAIETGRTEEQADPRSGEKVKVPIFKGESLELEELDRAIRDMQQRILEKDPRWTIENDPL